MRRLLAFCGVIGALYACGSEGDATSGTTTSGGTYAVDAGSACGDASPALACGDASPAPTDECAWSSSFGNKSDQAARSVAVDALGNIVIVGRMGGVADFGGGPLTSAGDYDAFIAKFDAQGHHLWSKRFGDAASQAARGVAIDSTGSVFFTGYFEGSIDFGGGALTTASTDGSDAFVCELDAAGAYVWSERYGGTFNERGEDIAIDESGNVDITGVCDGPVDFGGGALPCGGDETVDFFVVELDAARAHRWSRSFGGPGEQHLRRLTVDAAGDILMAGTFEDGIDLGGGLLKSAGGFDVFVAKLDTDGGHLWSRGFGSVGSDAARTVAADAGGNVLLTGIFSGTLDFGTGALTNAGGFDAFLVRLDPDGAPLWSKGFGGEGDQLGYGIAFDDAGDFVFAGFFEGTVDLGLGPLASAGADDIFLAKFDAEGAPLWSSAFGDAGEQYLETVAIDPSGGVIIVGTFEGSVDFGHGALKNAGSKPDVFVAKFCP